MRIDEDRSHNTPAIGSLSLSPMANQMIIDGADRSCRHLFANPAVKVMSRTFTIISRRLKMPV